MKTVIKGYKYRIYSTEDQKVQIEKTFGCSRFIYNHFLAMKIELYKKEKQSLSYNKCSKLLTELKKEKEWLKEPDKLLYCGRCGNEMKIDGYDKGLNIKMGNGLIILK